MSTALDVIVASGKHLPEAQRKTDVWEVQELPVSLQEAVRSKRRVVEVFGVWKAVGVGKVHVEKWSQTLEVAGLLRQIGKSAVRRQLVDIGCPGTVARLADIGCTMKVDTQAVFESTPCLVEIEHRLAHNSGDMKTVG